MLIMRKITWTAGFVIALGSIGLVLNFYGGKVFTWLESEGKQKTEINQVKKPDVSKAYKKSSKKIWGDSLELHNEVMEKLYEPPLHEDLRKRVKALRKFSKNNKKNLHNLKLLSNSLAKNHQKLHVDHLCTQITKLFKSIDHLKTYNERTELPDQVVKEISPMPLNSWLRDCHQSNQENLHSPIDTLIRHYKKRTKMLSQNLVNSIKNDILKYKEKLLSEIDGYQYLNKEMKKEAKQRLRGQVDKLKEY